MASNGDVNETEELGDHPLAKNHISVPQTVTCPEQMHLAFKQNGNCTFIGLIYVTPVTHQQIIKELNITSLHLVA